LPTSEVLLVGGGGY